MVADHSTAPRRRRRIGLVTQKPVRNTDGEVVAVRHCHIDAYGQEIPDRSWSHAVRAGHAARAEAV